LLMVSRFQQLFSIAIFAEWLFYMIAASTIFIFRKRLADVPRPYRTWGYPVVPAIFIAAAAFLLYSTFAQDLRHSLMGSAVILSGVPVFLYFRLKSTR
jgi:basic amino acid/polyamine antiporter, APA family